jgi:hypothetical protein
MDKHNAPTAIDEIDEAINLGPGLSSQLPKFAFQVTNKWFPCLSITRAKLLDCPAKAILRVLIQAAEELADWAVTALASVEDNSPLTRFHDTYFSIARDDCQMSDGSISERTRVRLGATTLGVDPRVGGM